MAYPELFELLPAEQQSEQPETEVSFKLLPYVAHNNLLLQWFNCLLKRIPESSLATQIHNLSLDLQDGRAYIALLRVLAPEICTRYANIAGSFSAFCLFTMVANDTLVIRSDAENLSLARERAEFIVRCANELGCTPLIVATDILEGIEFANVLFLTELFQVRSGLSQPQEETLDLGLAEAEYRAERGSLRTSRFAHAFHSPFFVSLIKQ